MKKNNGFTIVEALLAMTIVIFIVVGILSGFTQQMVVNRFAGAKNIAISLAETKLEEYLKYPASQMPAASVDYVVERGKQLVVSTVDPDLDGQYRRTATVASSALLPAVNIVEVTVEYGRRGDTYPFRVVLNSQRGG